MRLTTCFHLVRTSIFAAACVSLAGLAAGQQGAPELPAASPKARVEQRVGLTDFSVDYSSPGVKDREIWGGLVPYGEVWRTGANRATKLKASGDFEFGGVKVKAGEYSLLSIPGEKEWTVILNGVADLPGTRGYDQAKDAARVKVTPEKAPARERMTFLFSDSTDDSTRLDLEWAGLRVSVPITVATSQQVTKNIDAALAEAWRPHFASARYLLESGGDLAKAREYIDTSIGIKATWWNTWWKAQILAKQGDKKGAVAAAQEAQKLGAGDEIFDGFFAEGVKKSIAEWQ